MNFVILKFAVGIKNDILKIQLHLNTGFMYNRGICDLEMVMR